MGNEASSPFDDDDVDPFEKFDGIETLGYRVLGVQPDSPASKAGLVSFFDFLVGADGQMLLGSGEGLADGEEYDDVDFPNLLRESVGKELELLVWNIKSQQQRLVKITPSDDWGGTGLLGVTIRLDDYGGADERLIRVLSVEHNSPAAIAGLSPLTDYLLGTTTVSFDDDAVLAKVLTAHADRVVELYVYNTESDLVRVVALMPTLSWGGRGLLGAEVGTGYLHRLPRTCRGTDGSSVERRIRMGARPSDAPRPLPTKDGETAENGSGEPRQHQEGEMVDLTALTESVAGTAIHFEGQMEMEPEPEPTQTSAAEGSQSGEPTVAEEVNGSEPKQVEEEQPQRSGAITAEESLSGQMGPASDAPAAKENGVRPPPENPSGQGAAEDEQRQPTSGPISTVPSSTQEASAALKDAASLFSSPPPDQMGRAESSTETTQSATSTMAPPPFIGGGSQSQLVPPAPGVSPMLASAAASPSAAAAAAATFAGTGLPPPPITQLADSPDKAGQAEVDLR